MKLFAPFLLAALLAASGTSFAADNPAPEPAAAAPAKLAKPDLPRAKRIQHRPRPARSCHNADGNSAIAANPKLAQQHPEYILKQLQDFKSGKRKSAIMKPMAAPVRRGHAQHRVVRRLEEGKPASPRKRTWSPWARRSTAAASPIARVPPAPAATARTAPAFRPVPAPGRPACRLHRGAAQAFPRRRAVKNSLR
jgi:cytochrome c553